MFRKIISSLPYNPGLLHSLSFYAKRLHQEEAVRRVGVIFTLLALGVQTAAILVPAETSLATSSNDIVYGATSKQAIVNAMSSGRDNNGRADIKQIYAYYGITLNDVQNSSSVTVASRERQYITTGRGDSPGVDTPIQIPGTGTTIYERSLNVWDIKNYQNTYPAIKGTATGEGLLKGRTFWILLKGCGNITFEPLPREPKLEISKSIQGDKSLEIGDTAKFLIEFRNAGDAPAEGLKLRDTLAPEFEFVSQTNNLTASFQAQGQHLSWDFLGAVQPSQTWQSVIVETRVTGVPDKSASTCNTATLSSTNAGSVEASASCDVKQPVVKLYSRISTKKQVKNLTKGIEDANNTTASPGDELEYSLTISNTGNTDATNYIPDSDVLNDVLAYADLTTFDGASFNRTHNRLTWPATKVPANGSIVKSFKVKIKDPLPTTPASLSDPHLYDFMMVNTFGNQVIVKIEKPVINQTYETVTTIPNTGPGASIVISLLAAAVIGYFYARSRLLAKEVDIIKSEQLAGV